MATNDYRMSLYLGSEPEGRTLKEQIAAFVATDLRFKDSEGEFVRYCIKYALENDPSLARKVDNASVNK